MSKMTMSQSSPLSSRRRRIRSVGVHGRTRRDSNGTDIVSSSFSVAIQALVLASFVVTSGSAFTTFTFTSAPSSTTMTRGSKIIPFGSGHQPGRHDCRTCRHPGLLHRREATLSPITEGSRVKHTGPLTEWAVSNGIGIEGVQVGPPPGGAADSGLALTSTRPLSKGEVVIQVPTKLALTVETPKDFNPTIEAMFFVDRNAYTTAPWWAKLSLRLNALDRGLMKGGVGGDVDMRPWLDSLPRQFGTPLHWTAEGRDDLQYPFLRDAIAKQETSWKSDYESILRGLGPDSPLASLSFDEYVWGCECARSRAFSGAYSGSAFNPLPYAFTLILVGGYVALNLGTIEQAANGAAVVLCGTILKDFVLPKLLKVKKFVICPYMDMANHRGTGETGDVAFEYFSDGYSLSLRRDEQRQGSEVYISYGPRSNDQLLQYYGFVEANNVHDVYIMPSLREWDIGALEKACGRTFNAGRLQKLERAGLLGLPPTGADDETARETSSKDSVLNRGGGVVVSRNGGIDPAVMQALRALVSTDAEWEESGEAIGTFSEVFSSENERVARLAAKTGIELELLSKPTTLQDDEAELKRIATSKSLVANEEDVLALRFRIEKKKLLVETMAKL